MGWWASPFFLLGKLDLRQFRPVYRYGRSGWHIVSGLSVRVCVQQTFKVGNNILSYWT